MGILNPRYGCNFLLFSFRVCKLRKLLLPSEISFIKTILNLRSYCGLCCVSFVFRVGKLLECSFPNITSQSDMKTF